MIVIAGPNSKTSGIITEYSQRIGIFASPS